MMKLILTMQKGIFPVALQVKYLEAIKKKHYIYSYDYKSRKHRKAKELMFDDLVMGPYRPIITFQDFKTILRKEDIEKNPDAIFKPVFEDGIYRFDKVLIRVIEENPELCGDFEVVEVPDGERFIILDIVEQGWRPKIREEILMEKDMVWYPSETKES